MKIIIWFIACFATIIATPPQQEAVKFNQYPLTEIQKKEIILNESEYEKKLRQPIPRQDPNRYTQEEVKTIIRQEVARQGGSMADVGIALAIAEVESGYRANAKNPNSSASGVYQLLDSTADAWGVVDVFDPFDNCAGAIKQIIKGNLSPWNFSRAKWEKLI